MTAHDATERSRPAPQSRPTAAELMAMSKDEFAAWIAKYEIKTVTALLADAEVDRRLVEKWDSTLPELPA